jgi:hypothetical protein
MSGFGWPEVIVILVVAILLIWGGKFGLAIRAIQDMFRGGPRPPSSPPSHPLSSDDSEFLNFGPTSTPSHWPDHRFLFRDVIEHRHTHAEMLVHQ